MKCITILDVALARGAKQDERDEEGMECEECGVAIFCGTMDGGTVSLQGRWTCDKCAADVRAKLEGRAS